MYASGSHRDVEKISRRRIHREIDGLQPHATAKWLSITSAGLKELQDLGEIDTADPATLRTFIERLRNEPAERRAVVFWDHGSSFSFGSDDSARNPSDSMSVTEIAAQFRVDPRDQDSGYLGFDLIGFKERRRLQAALPAD